jgi:hypothetical protein
VHERSPLPTPPWGVCLRARAKGDVQQPLCASRGMFLPTRAENTSTHQGHATRTHRECPQRKNIPLPLHKPTARPPSLTRKAHAPRGSRGAGTILMSVVCSSPVRKRLQLPTCTERVEVLRRVPVCKSGPRSNSPLGRVPPCVSEGGRAAALCASRGMLLPTRADNTSTSHKHITQARQPSQQMRSPAHTPQSSLQAWSGSRSRIPYRIGQRKKPGSEPGFSKTTNNLSDQRYPKGSRLHH